MFPYVFFASPWVLILWIGLSWLVGMLGKNKRFGFFGNFLVAFLFSPLVGAIILMASDNRSHVGYRKSR